MDLETIVTDSSAALSRPAIPPEIDQFAAEKGIGRCLSSVIDLARQAFPSSVLRVAIGRDAEDETRQYVAIDAEVSGQTTDELLAGQRVWSAGITRTCSSRQTVYFVLGWR